MKPRITISLSKENVLQFHLNEAGRDLLIKELLGLNEMNDHFHLSSNWSADIALEKIKYASDDTLIDEVKILLRKDEWDKEYYPHVLGQE